MSDGPRHLTRWLTYLKVWESGPHISGSRLRTTIGTIIDSPLRMLNKVSLLLLLRAYRVTNRIWC